MDPIFLSCVLAVLVILYVYLNRKYDFWEKRGIPYVKGATPLLGHSGPILFARIDNLQYYSRIYDTCKNSSIIGFYDMTKPVLMVREPELVKEVMQTSFQNFHENSFALDPKHDPLLCKNPFFSKGEMWMNSRKRLTYAFSSMRLKILSEAVRKVSDKFENFVEGQIKENGKYEVELKDLSTRFTGEVVASAGFGVEGQCFEDHPVGRTFRHLGDDIFADQGMWLLRAMAILPGISMFLQRGFLSKNIDSFFRNLVTELWEVRKKETVRRNDFLQLMLDMEKTEGKELDVESIAAYAVSFFIDGYETSAVTISYLTFLLASNPEVQEKLRQEVITVLEKHNGMITYDSLKEMTYMDQAICESQRLYPVMTVLQKVCTNEYELKGSDGLTVKAKPGMPMYIPISSLHRDPKYWSNPDVFDPDRFSDERKNEIQKYSFLPFGEGPRMCVGMRMGLLQVKACTAALMRKFRIKVSPKTQIPLLMNKASFLNYPIGGLWVIIESL